MSIPLDPNDQVRIDGKVPEPHPEDVGKATATNTASDPVTLQRQHMEDLSRTTAPSAMEVLAMPEDERRERELTYSYVDREAARQKLADIGAADATAMAAAERPAAFREAPVPPDDEILMSVVVPLDSLSGLPVDKIDTTRLVREGWIYLGSRSMQGAVGAVTSCEECTAETGSKALCVRFKALPRTPAGEQLMALVASGSAGVQAELDGSINPETRTAEIQNVGLNQPQGGTLSELRTESSTRG